jgi:hypothetical protein
VAEVMNHGSSFIASTTYYHFAEEPYEADDLVVEFTDGASFVYHGVPRGTYTSFISSGSKGRAFHQLIKPFGGEEV